METQTGLGADAQRKAVRLLVRLGVLETTRRGVQAGFYYRVDLHRLAALLLQDGQAVSVTDHHRQQDTGHGLKLDPEHGTQQDAGDGRRQGTRHGPRHKENNKDIKEEIKGDIPPSPPKGAGTPPKKPGRQSTPKHPVPEDFTVTSAMRTCASEHASQVDLDHETLKLVAWARAKGECRSDWVETWKLWMLNAAKPGPRGQRRAASPPRAAHRHPQVAGPKTGAARRVTVTEHDFQAFGGLMAVLEEVFDKDFTLQRVEIYFRALAAWPIERIKDAVDAAPGG